MRRRTDKGRPAFLRQHTGRPYRVPVEEDEVAAEEHSVQRKGEEEEEEEEEEEKEDGWDKDTPANKTAVPLEGAPKAPGQSGPPLLAPLFQLLPSTSLTSLRNSLCFILRCEYRTVLRRSD